MDFKTMKEVAESMNDAQSLMAYCDYISYLIQKNLKALDTTSEKLLGSVGKIQFLTGPNGEFTTTKRIEVEDRYGKKYKITIEEA